MGEVETQENLNEKKKSIYLQEKKICWEYIYILFFDFCSLSIILWIASRKGKGRVREDRI